MGDAVIQPQLQVGGPLFISQGKQSVLGHFGEIDFSGILESQPQAGRRDFEHDQEVLNQLPFTLSIHRIGQLPDSGQLRRCIQVFE